MPGRIEDAPAAGGHDELDDLFDYDVSPEDLLRNANEQAERQVGAESAAQKKPADLGLDEEIKVEKKRAPVAKLDIERLLSPKGIPKLRRITKDRLKLKGKGHEFTDVGRLLNLYQLWLDDLYPRAKFADGLAIIEKLGHQKRLQTMRKEWIDEGKPKTDIWDDAPATTHEPGRQDDTAQEQQSSSHAQAQTTIDDAPRTAPTTRVNDDLFLTDDEADVATTRQQPADESMDPPEDELDALLAEDEARDSGPRQVTRKAQESSGDRPPEPQHDDFEDDMEAMAEMDMW